MNSESTLRRKQREAVILLVEDDPADQRITQRAFERGRLRNKLHIVPDGAEALDYLYRRGKYEDPKLSPRPDLILLDLNLPKLSGRDVMEELNADPSLKRIAVTVLTTSAQEEDIIQSYDLGVNSYITKPVTWEGFMKVVETIEEYWFEIVELPPKEEQ